MKMVSEKIIIKEMIKPSSPTPPHFKTLQLSFLDQLAPPTYIHIILYFEAPDGRHDSGAMTPELKRSLSDALGIYYPLAGKIRDDSWVDCNDDGAEYVEARFNDVRISDVVEERRVEELQRYVPLAPSDGGVPLAVQASFFGCGGAAVGVCMSHKVADATTMVAFVNAWAAACRRDAKTIAVTQPSFDVSSRFPPSDFSYFYSSVASRPPPPRQNIVTKIFTFDAKKLAALRKAASGPLMEKPTRVEAVSAFIWKHLIDAAAAKNPNGVFAASHVVDIRRRASPPLPPQFSGNACARAMAMTEDSSPPPPRDYYSFALKLRETIKKADADYVKRLEDGGEFLKYYAVNEENDPALSKGLEVCAFTSWCRMPAYDADFGWGKPVWVSIIGVPVKNLIFFLGTKSGDGIEAWVSMDEEDVAAIETNHHLIGK